MSYPTRSRDPAPHGRPWRLIGALALAALVTLLIYLILQTLIGALDPLARSRAAWLAAREQRQAAQLAWLDTAVAAGWRVLPLVFAALGGSAALGIVRRWGDQRFFDRRYDIQQTRAAAQRYPAGLHSLSAHYHDSSRHETPAIDGVVGAPALPPPSVPTFAQLLASGQVGRGRELLLGVDPVSGTPIQGAWSSLYSTIVAGISGSGKTTSQRFLACQAALHGARFVVIDPQQGGGDETLADTLAPLASVYLCAPARELGDILQAARMVQAIGDRRMRGLEAADYPVLLWLDEGTSLLGHSPIADELAGLIEQIAQQYRKKRVYASASGQVWAAVRTGGSSALRDSFASVLCHRMRRTQARLVLPTDVAARAERLPTGQAILWGTDGATQQLVIPNTTPQDVMAVGAILRGVAPVPPAPPDDPRPFGFQAPRRVPPTEPLPSSLPHSLPAAVAGSGAEVGVEAPTSRQQNALNPRSARVRQLLAQKTPWNQIIEEVWGVTSGRRYQAATEELRTIVAELIGTGGPS